MNDRILYEHAPLRLKACRHGMMMYFANDQFIGRSLDLYGEFSEGEIEAFAQILRPGMTVVDAGANIGAHTLYFAEAVGPGGAVIAFEPQRALHQLLCGNLALNGHSRVHAHLAALGHAPGTAKVPPIDYSKGANFGALELGNWTLGEEIPVVTLDSLGLAHCHLIKIDVEGMELDVLEGAADTVARHQPVLYVESDRPQKAAALIRWLLDRRYRLYAHLPLLFNPKNYFGNADNVFGAVVSGNILCLPAGHPAAVQGAPEITQPETDLRYLGHGSAP
jgi:FkbM family methyltransferase